MCRLLGVVSQQPGVMGDLVAHDLDPFLALAREHGDGWGVALRARDRSVEITKDPGRVDTTPTLRTLLETSRTDAALLHLRMASQNFPVNRANTHPFGDRSVAFAHNGDFTPATSLDDVLGPDILATAEGDTDSERFYLTVRRHMDGGLSPVKAVMQAAEDIRCMADGFASLNCLLLSPDGLLAYTEHDPGSPVIARRGSGYFGLHYRRYGGTVVVASTGWPRPQPDWTALPERCVLEITPGSLTTTVHAAQ